MNRQMPSTYVKDGRQQARAQIEDVIVHKGELRANAQIVPRQQLTEEKNLPCEKRSVEPLTVYDAREIQSRL